MTHPDSPGFTSAGQHMTHDHLQVTHPSFELPWGQLVEMRILRHISLSAAPLHSFSVFISRIAIYL